MLSSFSTIYKFFSFKTPIHLLVFLSLFFSGIFALGTVAFSAYEKYAPGEAVTLGEFVYDDNFAPTTTACVANVSNPSGVVVVNDVAMNSNVNGWHYYTFTPASIEGVWPASMSCGSALEGNLSRIDKSFIVGYVSASTTPISKKVWENSTRTLTDNTLDGGGVLATESYVDTVSSSIIGQVNENQTLISNLHNISAADVWTYAGRDLDTPIIVTEAASAAVWERATLSLTSAGSIGKLITDNLDAKISTRGTSSLTAADVWSVANRTLTDYATSTITAAIWDNANRTLTNYGNDITAEDVWNVLTDSITVNNSIGKQLKDNADAKISTIADSVWSSATRTLTDYATSSIVTAVWDSPARTLTSFGTLVSDIWSDITAPNRKLTSATLTGGGTLATENYLINSLGNVTSSIITEVLENRNLLNNLNNISAEDVWTYAGRDLDTPTIVTASTSEAVWKKATNTFTSAGSIGKLLADNLDAKISTRGTSMLTAADVWDSANRTLTDYATSSIALGVWTNAARTLTNYGNDITAEDVWNVLTNSLDSVGTIGKQLADNTDAKASTIIDEIQQNRVLINGLSSISAEDVWTYAGRDLDTPNTVVDATSEAVWNKATATLNGAGTVGKLFVDNLDAKISTRGTSSITAADVWSVANRTLTDYSTSTITDAIWTNANRTLTNYGNDIAAADVWNVLTNTLLNVGSIGKLLNDNVDVKGSTIVDEIQQNRVLINGLSSISAEDVWTYAGRDLDTPNTVVNATSEAVWNKATATLNGAGTVGKLFVDNLDAKISTRGTSSITAADVWSVANRTLTDYSTSTITQAIWANANRTLTNYGNDITAADVWNVLTNTLLNVGSIGKLLTDNVDSPMSTRASLSAQSAGWTVRMSDASSIAAGKTYRAKLYVLNNELIPTDANALPVITVYDSERNVVVAAANMAKLANGVYEYTYAVANGANPGLWETSVSTEVTLGKTIQTNDFWVVEASPAQVIINSITDDTVPSIASNITITNEGLSGYEYHYEWCIVTNANNNCGGGDDTFYGSAAKFINPGDDWNTTLTGTVPNAGNYFFKLVVYFGTDHSSASRFFSAVADPDAPVEEPSRGGGGGGGGGGAVDTTPTVIPDDSSTIKTGESGKLITATPENLFLTINIPKDTIISDTVITAKAVAPTQVGVSSVTPNSSLQMISNSVFDITSSNGQNSFKKPVRLTFNYTDEQIHGITENTLKVYWYNANLKKWEVIPSTIYPEKNMIVAEVNHFSVFGLFGQPSLQVMTCNGADFNHDKKVNSIDFSILLAFWKTTPPFRNICVDVNNDKNVNSVDFSILMYEWGSQK